MTWFAIIFPAAGLLAGVGLFLLGRVRPAERTHRLHRLRQVCGGRRVHPDREKGPGIAGGEKKP